MSDELESRTWYRLPNEGPPIARLFLVRAPLTFGHSQLDMEFPETIGEPTRFLEAAKLISMAIFAFKEVLTTEIITGYREYAEITLTKNDYIKTLILRTSANEDVKVKYKIHLVPYFKSHEEACQKRFTSIHKLKSTDNGELIGWLGERENIIDKWEIKSDNPFDTNLTLESIAKETWKLPELAKLLHKEFLRAGQI